ncbi:hypothetical protein LTR08_000511 [Meristemomyces frigidus]|nr:hypothetical protein LTR08_000511 [Meristemomyces frigidus]
MATAQPTALSSSITKPGSQPVFLSHQAIIWLVIVSVIVFLTFATVIWLLCRCSCSKRRRRRSLRTRRLSTAVLDDRNDYREWNHSAPLSDEAFGQGRDSVRLAPLTQAAMRPADAAHDQHPGQPVVVDDAAAPSFEVKRSGSRYYSRSTSWRESAWNRLSRASRASQIGRAY